MEIDDWAGYLKFLAGLVAIVNPIGATPLFVTLTTNQSKEERNRTGLLAAVTVMLVLILALLTGEAILRFFDITISSFRVGGGILILLMSISMMQGRLSAVKHTDEETQDATEKEAVAVVPLGMPLLAGPGAISTVILYANRGTSVGHYLVLATEILVVALIVWLSLRSAPFVASALGKTGVKVVTRIMGLIMAAIGVEFITNGLKQLLPGLS